MRVVSVLITSATTSMIPNLIRIAGQHVDTGVALLVGGLEHSVGFAHASRGAKEDLQPAARLPALIGLNAGEQQVGIGPFLHIHILNQKCRQCGIRNV
jgi:hypothetical protein